MVRSGWLKRFSEKMSATFLSARLRGETRKRRIATHSSQAAEYLEDRGMMSVSTLFLSGTGELAIELDSGESVRLNSVAGRVAVSTSVAGGPYVPDTSIGTVASASVRSINILGGDEANTIDLSGVLAVNYSSLATISIDAANGHDELIGSPDVGAVLLGGDGNDTLRSGAGNDLLLGGDGNDSITAGAGNDNVQAGDGHDTVTGGSGNDLIDLGDGNDTANAGDGNDTVSADDGQDSIIGGRGNDTLNGGMGNDTLIGNEGNDAISGGTDDDSIFGDSQDPAILGAGVDGIDTIFGGAGDDTIIGGSGADQIDGGSGDDRMASTPFITTTSDPLPTPQTNVNAGIPVPLADASPTGLATSDVGTFHTITTGNLDGGLAVTVDATGKFGAFSEIIQPNPVNFQIFFPFTAGNPPIAEFKGWAQEGAIYNPIGDGPGFIPDQTTIESTVYFRLGTATGIPRVPLDEAALAQGQINNILGTTTEATSNFQIATLDFDLTQQVQPQFDLVTTAQVGTLLTQTYVITNTGTAPQDFEFVRYLDGDLNFDGLDELGGLTSNDVGVITNGVPDGASPDGGGHLINQITGDEFLFETEQGGVSSNGTFIGITSKPNPPLPPAAFPNSRFELSLFPGLRTRILNGDVLRNQVANDANSDGSVDPGQEGNVTFALRNVYLLQPGESAVYTTHTIFGNGRPDQIQFNRGPVTARDGNDPNDPNDTNAPIVALGNEPVTIDVVKNDSDLDGTIDFTSVQIDTLPSKGTVEVIGDGRIRYTPDPTTSRETFSFTYTVADNLGSRSIPTLVFVAVNPDSAADNINGGLGNDTLIGADGNDTLFGGGGTDSIFGGVGQDNLGGQSGNDAIVGGGDSDTINGGAGEDSLASVQRSAPSLFVNDVTVVEGTVTPISNGNQTVTFTITLDHPIELPVTFDFAVLGGTAPGQATAGADFVAASGTLTIAPCETSITLPVVVLGDTLAELTETYTVVLSNLQNAQVGKAVGQGTILNNGLTFDNSIGNANPVNGTREIGDQNTVQIAVNPVDTRFAVMVTNDRPGSFLNRPDPTDTFLNGGPFLGVYVSNDGGRSWSPSPTIFNRVFDGVFDVPFNPESRYHASIAYDRQGNLHVVYVAEPAMPTPVFTSLFPGPTVIVYAISRDNGQTFQPQLLTGRADGNDRPNVAVGPDAQNPALDAVYVTFHTGDGSTGNPDSIVILGAQVPPALPNLPPIQTPVPQFFNNLGVPNFFSVVSSSNSPNFPIATVGPNGEVAVTWQTPVELTNASFQGPSTVNVAVDLNGLLGGLSFTSIRTVTSSDVGSNDMIPALNPYALNIPIIDLFLVPSPPDEQAYASPLVAYDRSGGPHNGRLYLVYVDEQANESDNMDIYLRFSDDDGSTFSDPVRVNDDLGVNSQFHPSLSVDQSNGVVVVGWYDARNDFFGGTADTDIGTVSGIFGGTLTGVNTDVEYFVTASYDGGESFMPNVLVSGGSSNAIRNYLTSFTGALLGNYTGITVANGVILAAWADNSNSTGDNPDGTSNTDIYVARLTEATTGTASTSAFTSQADPGDLMLGGDGNDTLHGSDGLDTLNGQGGNDRLFGECNDDLLFGGAGLDTLSGGFGVDTLDGQGGADLLFGDADNDTYIWRKTSAGNDTVSGNSGLDTASVLGTNGADLVTVGQEKDLLTVTFGSGGILRVAHPGAVMSVVVNGLGGNDTLTVGTVDLVLPLVLSVDGGNGDDFVTAAGANLGGVRLALLGGIGNDKIHGSNGKDTIDGGAGNDSLLGFAGNDTILGETGIDTIGGGLGNDSIDGGDGYDSLNGQEGDDFVMGGLGNDTLKGDDGNDTLSGGTGDDQLNGMAGNDSLLGSVGQDQLAGGTGNDTLDGGRDNDSLIGNTGNDRILGDHGADYINGGDGNNTIIGGDGNDTILSGLGNDVVAGGDGSDYVNTDGGDDTLIGGDGNDTLLGGLGRDLILGRDGDDSINGQGGTDTLAGNQGVDIIVADPSEINEAFSLLSLGANFLLNLGVTA